mmetsp:Transcript_13531/g.32037  ORF Transcript_13531/g.32037 Transcript_13531/m.32037 type:complete len:318 (-) Transcript_13531:11-964(-)
MDQLNVLDHERDEQGTEDESVDIYLRMLRDIFPTPSISVMSVCLLAASSRVQPKSVLGFLGTIGSGLCMFGLWRGIELFQFIVKQELTQLRELHRQRASFYSEVMSAVEARDLLEPAGTPPELVPDAKVGPDAFRYCAPGCTPLWFRRVGPEASVGSPSAIAAEPTAEGPQSLRWEWSPDRRVWIDLSTTTVPSGFWEGQEVAPSNKVFINRLRVIQALQGQPPPSAPARPRPLDLPPIPDDADVPADFLCPISRCVMRDPVLTPSGVTYDRPCVETWLRDHHSEPLTSRYVVSAHLYPNLALRNQIEAWARSLPGT